MSETHAAAMNTDDLCVEDLFPHLSPEKRNKVMLDIGLQIEKAVNGLVNNGFKNLTIGWWNILSKEHNPDGTLGFYRIVGGK